jgi:hypothetical protein
MVGKVMAGNGSGIFKKMLTGIWLDKTKKGTKVPRENSR